MYEQICHEFRCPICTEVLSEPTWLPCMHVFCRKCIRVQVVKEKTCEKLAKCAECKTSFSHRNLRQNKKFDNILTIFKSFREDNQLMTQIPAQLPLFNPFEAKERLLKNQKGKQQERTASPLNLALPEVAEEVEQPAETTPSKSGESDAKTPASKQSSTI